MYKECLTDSNVPGIVESDEEEKINKRNDSETTVFDNDHSFELFVGSKGLPPTEEHIYQLLEFKKPRRM